MDVEGVDRTNSVNKLYSSKKLNLVAIYVSWCANEKGGKKQCDLGVRKACAKYDPVTATEPPKDSCISFVCSVFGRTLH